MRAEKNLGFYEEAFRDLNAARRRSGDGYSPHQPVLLLALLESAESGLLKENRIVLDDHFREKFANLFEAVSMEGDRCNPVLPFFHLRARVLAFDSNAGS